MIPSVTISIVSGTCIGLLAHLVGGGDGRRLAFLILVSVVGFLIGETAGDILSIHVLALGPTNVLTGSIGAVLSAVIASILTRKSPTLY